MEYQKISLVNQYKKLERLCKEIRKKAKEKDIDLSKIKIVKEIKLQDVVI